MARQIGKRELASMMGLVERANKKFSRFDQLNAAMDAKVSKDMRQDEKLKLAANRDAARRAKAKIVTQQAYAMKQTIESAKGWHADSGILRARGKDCKRASPADVARMQKGSAGRG